MRGSIGSATSAYPTFSASVKSHATCASDFVPSLPNPSPRSTRPNPEAPAPLAASTISPDPLARAAPSRPPDSVDSVIARESPHASRRVACGRARAECQCARKR